MADLLLTGAVMESGTDEASIVQLRREIACRLITESGLWVFFYFLLSMSFALRLTLMD